jgi:uncharacterized protein (TIGR02145 family)
MKKRLLVFFSLAFSFCYVNSQDITISFAATGDGTTVDSVSATNLATQESLSFLGNESLVLHQGTTSMNEISSLSDIKIISNPFSSITKLSYINKIEQQVTINLVSLSGKIIASYTGVLPPGVQQYDVSVATKGLYVLSIITKSGIQSIKVIQNSGGGDYVKLVGTGALPKKTLNSQLKGTMANTLNYSPGDIISYEIKSGDNVTVVNETPTENKEITAEIVTCQDYDGNNYKVVKIDNKFWMTENLRVTHYPNGDAIPFVTSNSAWAALQANNTDDAMCYHSNNPNNAETHGGLYTYAAAIADNWGRDNSDVNGDGGQGICPEGWHLVTKNEWEELETYVSNDGHSGVEGIALKATTGWEKDGNGTDNYGFSAISWGIRDRSEGTFVEPGWHGYWWCSTGGERDLADIFNLSNNQDIVEIASQNKSYGFSVRCMKN